MIDYSRNWLFIDSKLQDRLKDLRLLIMGVGIGSVFAELALRTGIRNITIADGDTVDPSNLNRQNYTSLDLGRSKAQATAARLKAIDPTASIRMIDAYLDAELLEQEIPKADFVINTIDFDSPVFLLANRLCRQHGVCEFFPMNLGFGSSVCVFTAESPSWSDHFAFEDHVQLKQQILQHVAQSARLAPYLMEAAQAYLSAERPDYDPQLAISCSISSCLMMSLLIQKLRGEQLRNFPDFYFLDSSIPHVLLQPNPRQ